MSEMNNQIEEAIRILNNGGIVIFPTDTAFGIGCRMDREETIKRLFSIRKRPETQATPVLVSGKEMAKKYLTPLPAQAGLPKSVEKLMDTYWPGGLTIVYTSKIDLVPDLVRGGSHNLGVRMPDHETALSLIDQINVPLLGPSANFHEQPTPYTLSELDPELIKLVDYVVSGECKMKVASTVVDCTISPAKILRQGSVVLANVDLIVK